MAARLSLAGIPKVGRFHWRKAHLQPYLDDFNVQDYLTARLLADTQEVPQAVHDRLARECCNGDTPQRTLDQRSAVNKISRKPTHRSTFSGSATRVQSTCAVPNAEASVRSPVSPDTPEDAKEVGATGTAEIEVSLSDSGAVIKASVYTTTRNQSLNNAALSAAAASSYYPKKQNCIPVPGDYKVEIHFY